MFWKWQFNTHAVLDYGSLYTLAAKQLPEVETRTQKNFYFNYHTSQTLLKYYVHEWNTAPSKSL